MSYYESAVSNERAAQQQFLKAWHNWHAQPSHVHQQHSTKSTLTSEQYSSRAS